MILPVTLSITAATAVVNLWLAFRIVQMRMKDKVMLGDAGNPLLAGRMRAHANFVEYAPFVLLLLGLIEMAGGSAMWLWIAGVVFVVARILHGLGMDRATPSIPRAAGALGTWAILALLAGWALAIVATSTTPPAPGIVLAVPGSVRG